MLVSFQSLFQSGSVVETSHNSRFRRVVHRPKTTEEASQGWVNLKKGFEVEENYQSLWTARELPYTLGAC